MGITLDSNTVSAVTLGGTGDNAPNITFIDSSLTAASLTIQGKSPNNGDYPANPTLALAVTTVSVAGDIAMGRRYGHRDEWHRRPRDPHPRQPVGVRRRWLDQGGAGYFVIFLSGPPFRDIDTAPPQNFSFPADELFRRFAFKRSAPNVRSHVFHVERCCSR